MNKNYPFSEIQDKISSSQKMLIVLPASPKYDQVAGALALFLSLQQAGKTLSVVCPTPMTVEFHNLVGVDKVVQKAAGTDLVVSLNYSMDNVEKISYNDDGGRLNLVLQPKAGAPVLNEQSVNFSYSGAGADLVVTVGIKNINQLSSIGLASIAPESIFNIDNRLDNSSFAAINVLDADASSLSEIILGLLSGLGLPMDTDIGQNLLFGLWQTTQGLRRPEVGADAYEAVATLLRLGAQKPSEIQSQPKLQEPFHPKSKWTPKEEIRNVDKPSGSGQNPPTDWFEPKIFKSSGNI